MRQRSVLTALWNSQKEVLVSGLGGAGLSVVVALIVGLAAIPTYRAETNVSIRPRIADLGTAEASARLVRNYAIWVDSESYASRLTEERKGGLSTEQIVANVRTHGDPDRLLVTIQSEDYDRVRAAMTANALAEMLVAEVATPERVNNPEKGIEVAIIDPAKPPVNPVWPLLEIILPIAAVIGAFLGASVMWLSQNRVVVPTTTDAGPHV